MVSGASYNFRQTQRLYVIVDIDTARRCSGEDAADVDDVVRSLQHRDACRQRSECSHSYDH